MDIAHIPPSSESASTVKVSSPLNPSSPRPECRRRGHSVPTLKELPAIPPLSASTSSLATTILRDRESSSFRSRPLSMSSGVIDESVWKMSVGTPTSLGELASTSLDKDEFIPKESPKRRHALPAEQKEGWVPTRQRVDRAESSILGNALDVGQKVLMLGEVFLEFAPVPVLEDIAGMLLQIWDTLQLMNRLQCLRLTERCANILLSIRQEIHEAGDMVSTELTLPMSKLALAFSRVRVLLENLISFSSLKAHVKRKQILKQMAACNSRLQDAMGMFNISIQIRTLKHLQESNEERKKEAEVIIESLRRYNALQPTGIREEETTPKPPGLLGLPSTGSRTSLNTGPFKSPLSRSLSSTSEYHSRSTPLLPASS